MPARGPLWNSMSGRPSLQTLAVALSLAAPAACKSRRDAGAELRERTSYPDIEENVRSFVLGKGFKASQEAPTELICIKSAVADALALTADPAAGTALDAAAKPWTYYETSALVHPNEDAPPPAIAPKPQPVPPPLPAFAPAGAGAREDSLFVANEYSAYLERQRAGAETDFTAPLAATGLAFTDPASVAPNGPFSPENCAEDAIRAWHDNIRAKLALPDGPKRKIRGSSISYTRAFSLKQLATSLDINGKAVARALIGEASAQAQRKVTFNFESESVYQVINARIASDQSESIAQARWNTPDGSEPKAPPKSFYDLCGDEFISRRTFGAKYMQYFMSSRFETQSLTKNELTATVKVKLGPFAKSKSVSKGWEFSAASTRQVKEEWRYVATPEPTPPVPKTPACMSMFAETLADLTAVAEPTQGVPVSFESRPYRNELSLKKQFIPGQKREDGTAASDDLLDLLDMMTKHIGAIRDVLREPGQYVKLDAARRGELLARFKTLAGQDYAPDLVIEDLKPAGLFGEVASKGLKIIDDIEVGKAAPNSFTQQFKLWAAEVSPDILPPRFAYTYVVEPKAVTRATALEFCERLRINTFAIETLAALKSDNSTRAWRLPTLVEVRQLRHAFGNLLGSKPGDDNFRVHLWDAAPDASRALVLAGIDEADADPPPATPVEIDAASGAAATMCIFGPTDAALLQSGS